MRRGQRGHVEDFAIGGQPAVEIIAIPGGHALGAVVGVFLGHIDPARHRIGLADAIGAAALRHGIAEGHHPRAGGHAVFRIDAAGELVRTTRSWPARGMHRRQPRHAPPGKPDLTAEIPIRPKLPFRRLRAPDGGCSGHVPGYGPTPHQDDDDNATPKAAEMGRAPAW